MSLLDSPGTIALPTAEIGRFTLFTVCLASTLQPDNTNLGISASASVVENLNEIIRGLRDIDEWVWIIGDDHTWQPDTLTTLLNLLDQTPEADVLVPLVTKRNPPWHLVIFRAAGFDPIRNIPQWQPIPWEDVPPCGAFEIDAAGSAGMLIRRRVIDGIKEPWFASTNGAYLNEDVAFCERIRAKGFRIFATADVTMGHIGIFNVRPLQREGRWGAITEFSSTEEQFRQIFMPQAEELAALKINGR